MNNFVKSYQIQVYLLCIAYLRKKGKYLNMRFV
ncbi:hypothetical protein F383_26961 [Gossypium arboreum]|uniref:Uncharacterized protein n=1 Tax=Gossypium arboreum TaxID=29729 RepID=A0A0B0PFA5_GOSAR|nr:hypothetical protein F383_26961 [Gossypium arboreum]